jgi:hypothetical protein
LQRKSLFPSENNPEWTGQAITGSIAGQVVSRDVLNTIYAISNQAIRLDFHDHKRHHKQAEVVAADMIDKALDAPFPLRI